MTKEEVLKQCVVEGMVVKLPDVNLDRKLYMEVAKNLEIIGGKWKSGKTKGFIFNTDPAELLEKISGYEGNLKKDFQFFATPDDLADELVRYANIEDGMKVLEPSAGQGAIIEAIYRAFPRYMKGSNDKHCVTVDFYELMDINKEVLSQKIENNNPNWSSRTSCMGDDFLKADFNLKYDRIVGNPPFSKNQDIDHIYKMYEVLKPGGRIVTVASIHWKTSKNKKETTFIDWLDEVDAKIEYLNNGKFEKSGTNIASCIIVIDKL